MQDVNVDNDRDFWMSIPLTCDIKGHFRAKGSHKTRVASYDKTKGRHPVSRNMLSV